LKSISFIVVQSQDGFSFKKRLCFTENNFSELMVKDQPADVDMIEKSKAEQFLPRSI